MSEPTDIPLVPPKEAIAFFKGKGLAKSFGWSEILHAQHDYFFTVAKMMQRSLLEETQQIILQGLEEGESAPAIARTLKKRLAEAGWWGKQMQTDPLTGEQQLVQLGSNRRVRTIVNTNLRTSYSAGRYARQERTKNAFPFLVYKSLLDGRERPQHRAWHNVALPHDHPWWDTHYPPCDWGCRCRTVSMTKGQAERRGISATDKPAHFGTRKWVNKRTGEVTEIEKGIGAGWDYHPGKAPLAGLAPDPLYPFALGDDAAIASALGSAVDRFADVFDLTASGGVFADAAGWPLPVSGRWLMGLDAKGQRAAFAAAVAVTKPDTIRSLWVEGKDGQMMLVRRYLKGKMVVDIGGVFWRFGTVSAIPDTGTVVWPAAS